jgi:hypothetical protein
MIQKPNEPVERMARGVRRVPEYDARRSAP